MLTYKDAIKLVCGRGHKKLRYQTWLELVSTKESSHTIVLRHYNTTIIKMYPDGRYVVNTDGYHTKTTKDRLNAYLPLRVYQKDGVWYWQTGELFEDGDVVVVDGGVTPWKVMRRMLCNTIKEQP